MQSIISSLIDVVKTYVKKRRMFSNKEIVEIIKEMDKTKSSNITFKTGMTEITINRNKKNDVS